MTTARRGDQTAEAVVFALRPVLEDLGALELPEASQAFVADEPGVDALTDHLRAAGLQVQVGSDWTLDSLGTLESAILGNGVEVHVQRGSCRRPGRVRLPETDIAADLPVHIHGAACWTQMGPLRAILATLRGRNQPVATIDLSGSYDATTVAEAARTTVRLRAAGQSTRLILSGTATDPWAEAARSCLTEEPTPSQLATLKATWRTLGASTREQQRLLRVLDDSHRLSHLRALLDQPRVRIDDVADSPGWDRAIDALGPPASWETARRHLHGLTRSKMVLIPTWQCELRCVYCTIPKQAGRVMTPEVAERAVELLLSSDADDHLIHFFGGEPLLNFEVIQHTLRYGTERAAALGRSLRFQITSNAFSATEDKLDWLADYPVRFELSLDGDEATQTAMRKTLEPGTNSYARSPAHRAGEFLDRGFDVDTIMVVHKSNADRLIDNFWHLESMGYPRLQINFAYGNLWPDDAKRTFAKNLFRLGDDLRRRWQDGATDVRLINLGESLREVRTNSEVTVDWNGRLYGSNSFLYSPAMEKGQRLGDLDDPGVGMDRYVLDNHDADHIMAYSYRDKISRNNVAVGDVLTTFVRWMHAQGVVGPT